MALFSTKYTVFQMTIICDPGGFKQISDEFQYKMLHAVYWIKQISDTFRSAWGTER